MTVRLPNSAYCMQLCSNQYFKSKVVCCRTYKMRAKGFHHAVVHRRQEMHSIRWTLSRPGIWCCTHKGESIELDAGQIGLSRRGWEREREREERWSSSSRVIFKYKRTLKAFQFNTQVNPVGA